MGLLKKANAFSATHATENAQPNSSSVVNEQQQAMGADMRLEGQGRRIVEVELVVLFDA